MALRKYGSALHTTLTIEFVLMKHSLAVDSWPYSIGIKLMAVLALVEIHFHQREQLANVLTHPI